MYNFVTADGARGPIWDFYFDDRDWRLRYVVLDTGGWLPGRKVLIAPVSIGELQSVERRVHVALTRDQIESSPGIDMDKPVSRQMEAELAQYYAWPYYWGARVRGGAAAAAALTEDRTPDPEKGDSDLRSVREVLGYRIEARDGAVGHVEDFILDDLGWMIRYTVVDTRNWLPGKKVLVAPCLIAAVSWNDSKVRVDLPRELVEASPEYDPSAPVNREYEARWYDYYGRPKYWT
jgi:hypothetical protein